MEYYEVFKLTPINLKKNVNDSYKFSKVQIGLLKFQNLQIGPYFSIFKFDLNF